MIEDDILRHCANAEIIYYAYYVTPTSSHKDFIEWIVLRSGLTPIEVQFVKDCYCEWTI
jgi:hypothetical protein